MSLLILMQRRHSAEVDPFFHRASIPQQPKRGASVVLGVLRRSGLRPPYVCRQARIERGEALLLRICRDLRTYRVIRILYLLLHWVDAHRSSMLNTYQFLLNESSSTMN